LMRVRGIAVMASVMGILRVGMGWPRLTIAPPPSQQERY
jgi:hypothetical protein